MAAARVGVALEQHFVRRVEENQVRFDAFLRDIGEHLRQQRQILHAVAHVDADGEFAVQSRLRHFGDERRQQGAGQIVDAVVVEVFERAQRNGFARTGHAADDDEFRRHRFGRVGCAGHHQAGCLRIWCA